MRIALAQIDTTVGDLDGNAAKILDFATRAQQDGAQLAVFPELALTGYPPRDFVEKDSFLDRTACALESIVKQSATLEIAIVVGYVARTDHPSAIKAQNAAAVVHKGQIAFQQRKVLLPNYDVFDEARYFEPALSQSIWEFAGRRIALVICEDAWNDKQYWLRQRYRRDPVEDLIRQHADLVITINASPFNLGKRRQRHEMFESTATRFHAPVVYVNQVGGNDQLVFDGSSFADGRIAATAASFSEDITYFDVDSGSGQRHANLADEDEAAFEALVLGTRDYIQKCGFLSVLMGLSGGIDSALVATIAVEAIGKENVIGVGLPGPYSSEHSLTDARALAENLGIRFEVISINDGYKAMKETLQPLFAGLLADTTEENLQARLRGMTLMALIPIKDNALIFVSTHDVAIYGNRHWLVRLRNFNDSGFTGRPAGARQAVLRRVWSFAGSLGGEVRHEKAKNITRFPILVRAPKRIVGVQYLPRLFINRQFADGRPQC
jgi:NAD+ synthase/NAD+ synthase (glutamine-hydrolysing)